jgi:hypothetical protein
VERLGSLSRYAQQVNSKQRSLTIGYEQLIDRSDLVFKGLQEFLGTKAKFSEEYQILKTTGVRGIGDSSDAIKSGRILKTTQQLSHQIDPAIVDRAIPHYQQCREILLQYCQAIDESICCR